MSFFMFDKNDALAEYYELLQSLIDNRENETVEFKSATGQYSVDKIGQYFSAISNEANLSNKQFGWIVLGVSEDKAHGIVGTAFKSGDGQLLERLKYEISSHTTDGISFLDIFELFPYDEKHEKRRVLMLKVPAAVSGMPTAWNNRYYGREGDSLIALQQFKIDLIRGQERKDWSKLPVEGADLRHLDAAAIEFARSMYKEKMHKAHISEEVDSLDDLQFLTQIKLVINGSVTNACMLLLGREECDYFFDNPPKIMWRLYDASRVDKDYEIISIPFIKATDRVLGKIRNLRYRYLANQLSLFPEETNQYDNWLLRELLNNSIAHSDYQLGGRIYVDEFDDHITITNPGVFLPGSIEAVLKPGYNPPFYRNQRLADGMVKFNMIDTATSGIRKVYRIQRDKFFPMPDYDFSQSNKVSVTVYGKILDDKYTNLLFANKDLDLETVFLLDRVQKNGRISKADARILKSRELVEGRYPNLYISYSVAKEVGAKAAYLDYTGLDDDICEQYIVKILKRGPAKKQDLYEALEKALPGLTAEKKSKKLSNLLQKMRKEGVISNRGKTQGTEWFIEK